MNTQPEDNTKPETLRLAEWFETSPNTRDKKAAAELRRLHEEIQDEERRFNNLSSRFTELDKLNREFYEALDRIAHEARNIGSAHIIARDALAKARGNT